MPMSRAQLEQVERDYEEFIPHGRVIEVTQQLYPMLARKCDLCGHDWPTKRVIVENPLKTVWPYLRIIRMFICRNGVKCRERALKR